MPEFVYNRTQRHVDRLKLLQRKGYAKLSASEREEYHGYAALGAYNYTDVNRVEAAVAEIAPKYGLVLTTAMNRTYWTIPTMNIDGFDANRYLSNVVTIRDAAIYTNRALKFPALPDSMNHLTWDKANNIEETLHIAYEHVLNCGSILTWDGNTDGKIMDAYGDYVKVSDVLPTWDDFANGCKLALSGGKTHVIYSQNQLTMDQVGIYNNGADFIVVYDATGTEWPETGIYFDITVGTRTLTIPEYTGFVSTPNTISASHDGEGNVTVIGVTAIEDAGNVTLIGATATNDSNGNVTVR